MPESSCATVKKKKNFCNETLEAFLEAKNEHKKYVTAQKTNQKLELKRKLENMADKRKFWKTFKSLNPTKFSWNPINY